MKASASKLSAGTMGKIETLALDLNMVRTWDIPISSAVSQLGNRYLLLPP